MPKTQVINKDGTMKKDLKFWEKDFPEIVFYQKGYEMLYEEQHEDLVDYTNFDLKYSMNDAPNWRKRVGIERNTQKSDTEYETDLLCFHDNLLSQMQRERCPYRFGNYKDEMDFKKEDFPDHPDFVERSGATEMGVIQETYKYVLQKLRPGERRVVFREACLPVIENVIEYIHTYHFINGRKFSDDYKLMISNSPVPIYGHVEGILRDEPQITTNKDDTPYHKVLFVECVSKKAELCAELDKANRMFRRRAELGTCCICKQHMETPFGNNPHPIRKRGKCCEECNTTKVIPARMSLEDRNDTETHKITMKLITNWELKQLQVKIRDIMKVYPCARLYHEQVEEDVGIHQLHYRMVEIVSECGAALEIDFDKGSIIFTIATDECDECECGDCESKEELTDEQKAEVKAIAEMAKKEGDAEE